MKDEEIKKQAMVPLAILVTAVVVGAGAFWGGMKYQQSKQPSFGFNRQASGGQFGGRGGMMGGNFQSSGQNIQGGSRMGFRPVNGEIISSDDKSITVKLQDGSSKIVFLNDKTQINKADEASKEDLKSGEKVAVFGQENNDGSVTAQSIQLNPILRMMQNDATASPKAK